MVEKKYSINKKIIDDSYLQVACTFDWERTADFQERNSSLKKRMDGYNGGKEEWESFKIDLNYDISELDKALTDW